MPSQERTIHQRMVAILEEMPAIGKNQRNVQQGFMFRGHDDVLNALNPLLAKHGVFVVPDVTERVTSQRTTAKGSVMFEVSLHVGFTFWGAGGDSVQASAWGEGSDMGDKATSKAHTMAFKTALNQAFAISNADTDDPDRQTVEETNFEAPARGITKEQVSADPEAAQLTKELVSLLADLGQVDAGMDLILKNRASAINLRIHKDFLARSIKTKRDELDKKVGLVA